MATQLRDSSEGTPSIGTVPYSTTVPRELEHFDLRHHSSFTISIRAKLSKRRIIFPSSVLERAKVKKFGIDLIKRLARRSRADRATVPGTSARYDEIFGEHVENEGEAHRQARPDIPRPATPCPMSDATKNGEGQGGWKKRFVAMKNKHTTALRGKRSSLKTWLTQFDKSGLEVRDGKVVSSDTTVKPLRKKKSLKLRVRKWSSRPTTEIPKESEMSLSSPSLTPDDTTTSITESANPVPTQTPSSTCEPETPEEPEVNLSSPSSPSLTSESTTPIITPSISPAPPQTWSKRSSSTGSLRPQISFDKNLAVPTRIPKPSNPTLRTHPSTRSNPSLRPLAPINERNLHPSLRPQPFTRLNPPLLSLEAIANNTTKSPAFLSTKPPTLREKTDLVRSLNIARSSVCARLLDLHPLLCVRAQDYVGMVLPPLPPPKPLPLGQRNPSTLVAAAAEAASTAAMNHARQQQTGTSTKIETITFPFPNAAIAIRLVSPPGLGALACGELWAGGKYKRHKTASVGGICGHGLDGVEQHRFTLLPDFDEDGRKSFATVGSDGGSSVGSGGGGARWCGCAEYDSWEAITGSKWEFVGIGRAEDGSWVVELWEGGR